jgi:hypothetical protein
MSAFPLNIINLRKGATLDDIRLYLHHHNILLKGEGKRATKFGCTITIGLQSEGDRIKAGK